VGYKVKKIFRERSERNNFVPHFKNYGAAPDVMADRVHKMETYLNGLILIV
jgi:hypothetical protein